MVARSARSIGLLSLAAFAACVGGPGVGHAPAPQLTPDGAIASEAGEPMPRYLASPDMVPLGEAYVGEQKCGDFALEVLAPHPIELLAEVSCGCQELRLDGEGCQRAQNGLFRLPLSPGSHTLRVEVTAPKPGSKGLYLRLFDGDACRVLGLSLAAREELQVQPLAVELGEIPRGTPTPFEAVIVADNGKPFELTKESVHGSIHRAELVREAPNRWRVVGEVTPVVAGRGTAEVRLRSDRRFSDWVYVTVQWSIPIGLVAPAQIRFEDARPGTHEAVADLRLRPPQGNAAPVAAVEGVSWDRADQQVVGRVVGRVPVSGPLRR